MDVDDIIMRVVFWLLALFILGIISAAPLALFDGNANAKASDIALNSCISDGYNSYESFNRKFLSSEPLGIRCSYVRNEYNIDANFGD